MEHMLKLEEFKNLKLDDAVRLINNVPFLEWVNEKCIFCIILQILFARYNQVIKETWATVRTRWLASILH
jgi:hypothetical protein